MRIVWRSQGETMINYFLLIWEPSKWQTLGNSQKEKFRKKLHEFGMRMTFKYDGRKEREGTYNYS